MKRKKGNPISMGHKKIVNCSCKSGTHSDPDIILLGINFILLFTTRWLGEKRNAYRTLVGNPEGKRPLGGLRRSWVDNIKMDFREIGWDGMD
jgi:hypothetical protein